MKIEDWFENKIQEVIEFGGQGAQYEWFDGLPHGEFAIISTENRLKGIEIQDLFMEGVAIGKFTQKSGLKDYLFWHGCVGFFILAKDVHDLKARITKAIKEWKDGCEPLGPPPPTLEERTQALLIEIRGSHVGDPNGQTEQEALWCKEIDEILAQC